MTLTKLFKIVAASGVALILYFYIYRSEPAGWIKVAAAVGFLLNVLWVADGIAHDPDSYKPQ
jgi:hypothetical protein